MLTKVKNALRLTGTAYDDELTALIAAAEEDLEILGIFPVVTDPLVVLAVITYCKAHFGLPENQTQLLTMYDQMKGQMWTSGRHLTPPEPEPEPDPEPGTEV